MPLELSCTNEEKIRATLHPLTHAGQPATVDGPPQWAVTSGDATLEVEPDGMAAWLISHDTMLGDTVFQITADADLGAGVVSISDTILLHVTGALATSLGLTAETPVPK
jgi:hypothetical protein